jgi:ATP-dependent RNA helicase RhlE
MKFSQYHIAPEIKKSLEEMGFKKPTDIQFKSIPPILKREDVLAIAQTGTGKTAAFAIPILHFLHEQKYITPKGVKCIIMVPTHELAHQIKKVFDAIGQHTKIKTTVIHGGVDQAPQIEALQTSTDIVIGTPGRMFDLINQRVLDVKQVHTLVLDEADHMLDLGFQRDIQYMIKLLPSKIQTLFFSATINEEIKDVAYGLVKHAIRIQISPKDPVSKNITHFVCHVEMDDKRFFLERIINENPKKKILVFVRTKVRAERVCKALERMKIESITMHSDKDHEYRTKALEAFRTGESLILIATDVNARGIDIPNVDMVINYDLPDEPENYVHRVGRTGRGINKGQALSFCSSEEKETLEAIELYLLKPIKVLEIDKGSYQETIDLTEDNPNDWKSLLKEMQQFEEQGPDKKKKKKK